MRGFFLLCVIGAGAADKLGYDYRPLGHAATFEDDRLSGGEEKPVDGASRGFTGQSRIVNGADSGFDGFSNGYDAGNVGGTAGSAGVNQYSPAPSDNNNNNNGEYNKEFYSYTAPEEVFDDSATAERFANTFKKNLRVVFIRVPENKGLTNAAIALAKQAADEQTAIYVLTKQTNIADLANKLQSLNNNNKVSRPEVHFVKYRTSDDARRAQEAIQSQYDTLAGPSSRFNEGIAPVLDFSSSRRQPIDSRSSAAPVDIASNAYLPPALRNK